jgi:hypothetical protein
MDFVIVAQEGKCLYDISDEAALFRHPWLGVYCFDTAEDADKVRKALASDIPNLKIGRIHKKGLVLEIFPDKIPLTIEIKDGD